MKSKSIILILFFLLVSLTSVFATSVYSDTPLNAYGTTLNYETDAIIDGEYDVVQSTAFTSAKRPLICDVDNDGREELLAITGNVISVYDMNSAEFVLQYSINVQPHQVGLGIPNTINWITCQNFGGDSLISGSKQLIAVHMGDTFNESEIQFIEYNPTWLGSVDGTPINYGGGYYSAGYYQLQPHTEPYVSCDTTDTGEAVCGFAKGGYLESYRHVSYFTREYAVVGGEPQLFPINFEGICIDNYDASIGCYGQTIIGEFLTYTGAGTPAPDVSYAQSGSLYAFTIDASGQYYVYGASTSGTIRKFKFDGIFATDEGTIDALSMQVGKFSVSDITGNGLTDFCYHGYQWISTATTYARMICYDATGTSVLYSFSESAGSRIREINTVSFYDFDNNGDKEIVFLKIDKTDDNQNTIYWALTDPAEDVYPTRTSSGIRGVSISIVRDILNLDYYHVAIGTRVHQLDRDNTADIKFNMFNSVGINTAQTRYVVYDDMNNDYQTETITWDYITGIGNIYRHTPLALVQTITLANSSVYASGYFGFDTQTCAFENVTFRAVECSDGNTNSCTYYSTNELSKERLCTTCGGSIPETCGVYSYASPSFTCVIGSTGVKTIDLYLESNLQEGLKQGLASFTVESSSALTCNADILTEPADFTDPDAPVVPPEEPDTEKSDLEIYYDDWLQTLDDSVPKPIQLIASLVIISAFAIFMHRETNGNNYLTIVGSLMGAGISVALGLLAIELVLIIGIGLLVFVFVAYKFDKMR